MKKYYFFFLLCFCFLGVNAQNAPFVTIWRVDTNGGLDITIPTNPNYTYNYTIDFGDDTVLNNVTGDALHTYTNPGTYEVSITGDFPAIYFGGLAENSVMPKKIKKITQWGDVVWLSMEAAFKYCEELHINATDIPDLSQVTNMSYMFCKAKVMNADIGTWEVSNVTDMSYLFSEATKFDKNINSWDVSNVIDMTYMFGNENPGNISFNQPLSDWDVSNVETMKGMFSNAFMFNQDISNWNVSNVTDMSKMFTGTRAFNQDISNWNVSHVTNMSNLFSNSNFNKPIGNWDVSNVTDMSVMFSQNDVFNQSLDNWDVSQVVDMFGMFQFAHNFNQPLDSWNVSQVTSMQKIFSNSNFNQPLDSWNVSSVTNFNGMFEYNYMFNQPLNSWDVSSGTNFINMFLHSKSFNQPLDNWNITPSTNFQIGLENCGLDPYNYDLFLSNIYNLGITSGQIRAKNLAYCDQTLHANIVQSGVNIIDDLPFANCNESLVPDAFVTDWIIEEDNVVITISTSGSGYNYNIDFGDGTVQNNITGNGTHVYAASGVYRVSITGDFPRINFSSTSVANANRLKHVVQWGSILWASMEDAFYHCENLNIIASDTPNLSQVTSMKDMFKKAIYLTGDIADWDVSNVTDMSGMFNECEYFNEPLGNWDVSNVLNMVEMFANTNSFNQDLSNWDVSSVSNMESMFANALVFNKPLNNWNVSSVTSMTGMFANAKVFNQPLNDWDVSSVQNMISMFYKAERFNQPLDNWNVSSVISFNRAFSEASVFNQNLNNWDVSNATYFGEMFSYARMYNQPMNNWDMSSAIQLTSMFAAAVNFNQPLDSWNTSNVISMGSVFSDARVFDQSLNSWDTSNVTSMANLFAGAKVFNQPLDLWDTSNVTNFAMIFAEASAFNQDLSSWDFSNVGGGSSSMLSSFYSSGLDVNNYDNLLRRFAELGLQNKSMNNTGLKYCDGFVRNYLINTLNWTIANDELASGCNYISGTVRYDEDNLGCDSNDILLDNINITFSNGTLESTTFTNNGNYMVGVPDNNYTVMVSNLSANLNASPGSVGVILNSYNNQEVVDFCVVANQSYEDLSITLLPLTDARPGFDSEYQVVITNMGTQSVTNAEVIFTYDNTIQSYVNSSLTPSNINGSSLTFNITSLPPLQSVTSLSITMNTFTPPTVMGGEIINFSATVTPDNNDITPDNNIFTYDQVVVNSFDPNDKQVLQGDEITLDEVDEYLDYIIRFQNTGTASATYVRIVDMLSDKLDWSTFTPVSASDDYRVTVTNENIATFYFDFINLPDSTTDEPGSHGFVAFKIKPKPNVQAGDIINGSAEIYFDYNLPIYTNTVTTEVMAPMATTTFKPLEDRVTLYPNPAKDVLNIGITNDIDIQEVAIYNLQGQKVASHGKTQNNISLGGLASGLYIVEITTNEGVLKKQLVKN